MHSFMKVRREYRLSLSRHRPNTDFMDPGVIWRHFVTQLNISFFFFFKWHKYPRLAPFKTKEKQNLGNNGIVVSLCKK